MAKEKGGKKALAPKIEEQAEKLAQPIIEKAGCKLWDVCFEKEGAMWYLRVLFDNADDKEGLDSDRCEEISKPINELFDKQSFIEQVDILEIGTPGIYKKLRKKEHFLSCIGKRVTALAKTEKGEEFISGYLRAYDEEKGEILLETPQNRNAALKLSKCGKVNLDEETDEYENLDSDQSVWQEEETEAFTEQTLKTDTE